MEKEKITVIVPAYNVEQYVERCIASITSSTYRNLEVLIINDGSMDKTGEICEHLAVNDERIKVIHKKNGGLSDARNVGIDQASGHYISFIDADDYIDKNMYHKMHQAYQLANDIDIISVGMFEVFDHVIRNKIVSAEVLVLDKAETYKEFLKLYQGYWRNSFCNKLFLKSLFDHIRFKVGIISEDIELMYRLLERTRRNVCLNEAYYYYCKRANSITTSEFHIKQLDVIWISEEIVLFIAEKYPELLEYAKAFELNWLVAGWDLIVKSGKQKEYKKNLKEIKSKIRYNLKYYKNLNIVGFYIWISAISIILGFYRLFKFLVVFLVKVKKCLVKCFRNTRA